MGQFPPYLPAFKQKCFLLLGYCIFYQNQAWLRKVSLCSVCSECGLIHRTPSNLRLLTVCTPSRKGVMRASTATTFFLFLLLLRRLFLPPFWGYFKQSQRPMTVLWRSPHPSGAGCGKDRRGLEEFVGSLSPGWIQADCKTKSRCQGSWHEGPASLAQHICSSDHLDFLTQAVSSATCFMPQFLFWGWSHLVLAPFPAL